MKSLLLIWLALLSTLSLAASRKTVLFCFYQSKIECDELERLLKEKACEAEPVRINSPEFPTWKELFQKHHLDKANNVAVWIVGHSTEAKAKNGQHELALNEKDGFDTKEWITELHKATKTPRIFLSSCHAGLLNSPDIQIGTSSNKEEITLRDLDSKLNIPTEVVAKLYCDKTQYKQGELSSERIRQAFTQKFTPLYNRAFRTDKSKLDEELLEFTEAQYPFEIREIEPGKKWFVQIWKPALEKNLFPEPRIERYFQIRLQGKTVMLEAVMQPQLQNLNYVWESK